MFMGIQLSEQILECIGVAGFIFYMLSYALLQLGKISGQCYTYTLLNMLAASLVLISLTHQFNLASALIQISWIVISVVGIFRIWASSRKRNNRKRIEIFKY